MRYPAKFVRGSEGAINITFPDIPEAITFGYGEEEAVRNALDALESAFSFYFEDHKPIPDPSKRARNQRWVELPPTVTARVLLHNEMVRQQVRPTEMAKRLGVPHKRLTRLFDIHHEIDIDEFVPAFKALGRYLEVYVA
jgi:antitoxin HicB